MTHHTDAERAEFENWLDKCWSREGRCDEEGDFVYYDDWVQGAFVGWTAARRAPAAPVQQGWKLVPIVSTFEMDEAGMHPENESPPAIYRAMLAAAPQPPEAQASVSNGTFAAPVQLPEYGIDTANHAGIRVRGYTEQQVRELLAAHGIQERST